MTKIGSLLASYSRFIAVPWQSALAPAKRVVMCVYNPEDELRLRLQMGEFEIATRRTEHGWVSFDLTDTFAEWLSSQRYAKSYFQKPSLLSTLFPRYLDYIVEHMELFLKETNPDEYTVVALMGVGSLFGFLKVQELIERLAPMVQGRLLVFFPGTYVNNNYRLLNGYDGWNYLAVPITAD